MGKDAQDKKPDLYGNSADFGPPGVGNHEIADSSSIPICGLVGIMGFSVCEMSERISLHGRPELNDTV